MRVVSRKPMRVLVTGGCGFIGSHLVRQLASDGHQVSVLDLRAPINPSSGVSYFRGDVRDSSELQQRVRDCDVVFHLAAQASVVFCESNPVDSHDLNFVATVRILAAIDLETRRTNEPMRIVFCSSAAVYGASGKKGKRLSESSVTEAPLSHYALQKYMCERAMRLFHARNPLVETVPLRLFNVFGTGCDPQSPYASVIPSFAARIASNQNLHVFGTGLQTRDFVFVTDVANALIAGMWVPAQHANGLAFNIGSGRAVTIRELAQILLSVSNSDLAIEKKPARVDDIVHSVADNTRARRILNWKPEVDLTAGLESMSAELGFAPARKAA